MPEQKAILDSLYLCANLRSLLCVLTAWTESSSWNENTSWPEEKAWWLLTRKRTRGAEGWKTTCTGYGAETRSPPRSWDCIIIGLIFRPFICSFCHQVVFIWVKQVISACGRVQSVHVCIFVRFSILTIRVITTFTASAWWSRLFSCQPQGALWR